MNDNFHYFAVKAMARFSGFGEQDAQLIAEYSQFIDDYTTQKKILVQRVPQEAIDLGIAKASGDEYEITLVTTGFSSVWEQVQLIQEPAQNKILIPFHFILPQALQKGVNYNDAVRPASFGDGSILANHLEREKAVYLNPVSNASAKRRALIHIGMLLHLFADTYAHAKFTGHWYKAVNDYAVTEARRRTETSSSNVTSEYTSYRLLMALGHVTVYKAPDESNLSFKMQHQSDETLTDERDNTLLFKDVARMIGEFLRECNQLPPRSDYEYELFLKRMERGFFANNKAEEISNRVYEWSAAFPEYRFLYERTQIMRRLFDRDITPRTGERMELELGDREYYEKMLDDISEENINSATRVGVTQEFYDFTLFAAKIRKDVSDAVM